MTDNYTQDFIDEVKGALNSGSSGGGTIDQTARDDISNHVANSGVHVTVDDKTSWNNKAELSDIPTTLPASGGNADTVNNHTVETDVPVNAIFTDTKNSDVIADAAGIATLDGLQGGIPFSEIVVSGKNIFYGQLVVGMVGTTAGVIDSTSPGTTRYLSTTNLIPVKPNTQYTAQNAENKTLDAVVYYDENESLIGHTYISAAGFNSFTTPDNCKFVRWRYLFDSVQSDTSGLTNIQLEVGDTATEYEPPIIGQEITLTACGKNLIPYPYSRSNGIYNGITINISDDGKFSASGVATAGFTLITFANQDKPIKLVAGRTYTISCSKPYDINNFNLYFRIYHTDGTYSGVTSYPTTFIAKDGDYITGSLWVDKGTSFNVSNVSIQIELGDTATEYEPYSCSTVTITPDINPYPVPNDIRQQDGVNNISISAGEVSVTGVKKNAAIKKIWDNKADLSDIPIDVVSNTAEMVTLDGLQGGVPFSNITVSGKNLITQVLSAALGGNSTDGFRITDNPYCRSFVRKLLPNTTYTVKRYDNGNRFRIILFNEYPTITVDTTANQILNATTTPNEWTFTTGTDHLWFALTTHNGATDNTVVEPVVQLEYGDTVAEYEPPIVGQEITLTTCGKNLIPYPYYHSDMTVHGVTISDNGDGSITVNGTATDNVVFYFAVRTTGKMNLPSGEYFVSGCPKNSDLRIDISYTNDSGTASELARDSGNGAGFTMPYSAPLSVGLVLFSGKTYNHITVRPQLERGDNATEYKPYSGSTITITPDSNPYTVPNDIRQQDGINNVSVSAGEVSVTGVKKSPVINRVWEGLDSHTNNTTVHVTAEEKLAWNGKFDYIGVVHDLFAVNKTCVCAYDMNTLNTPFSSGLTLSGAGLCFVNYVAGAEYATYLVISSGDINHYAATSNNGSEHVKWHKISDGGNADTLDGKHASDFQIDIVTDTAASVTLDGLQGGVPFSDITISGKNLLKYPYENNVTRGGITYVLNDDGTISMSGTATEVSLFNLATFMDILLKKGITYTLSTGIIEGSAEQYDVALVTKSGVSLNSYVEVNIESNKKTFTPEYDIECRMLLRVLTGNTVNCTITAMLELGDNSTEYERPIVGKEITLTVNDTEYAVTPNSNPYTVQGIRQQEGINNVSVSAGEITVSGVKKSPAINRLWGEIENKISLSDIPDSLPANGGDAATLGSHPASDFVLKTDYDALAARVAALEARTTE